MQLIQLLSLLIVALIAGCNSTPRPPAIAVPSRLAQPVSHTQGYTSYSKIGLKIEVPDWNADIEEHDSLWTLFGFPLVDNPIADTQFCVTIQVSKRQEKWFRLTHPNERDAPVDLQTWINSSHQTTSQQSDAYWIYIRRDIFSEDGHVYMITAMIKRVGERWEFNAKARVGDYRIIADEALRMINSIAPL